MPSSVDLYYFLYLAICRWIGDKNLCAFYPACTACAFLPLICECTNTPACTLSGVFAARAFLPCFRERNGPGSGGPAAALPPAPPKSNQPHNTCALPGARPHCVLGLLAGGCNDDAAVGFPQGQRVCMGATRSAGAQRERDGRTHLMAAVEIQKEEEGKQLG
eukprot:scaffold93226_cov16-Tisochrysis_lutea.AAC.2